MPKRKADDEEESPEAGATEKGLKVKKEKKEKKEKGEKKEKKAKDKIETKKTPEDPPVAQQAPKEEAPTVAVPAVKVDGKEKKEKKVKEKKEKKEKKSKAAVANLFQDDKHSPVASPEPVEQVPEAPPQPTPDDTLPVARKGKAKEKKNDKKDKKAKKGKPQAGNEDNEEGPEDFWRGMGLTDGDDAEVEEDAPKESDLVEAAEEPVKAEDPAEAAEAKAQAAAQAAEAQRRERVKKAQEAAEAEDARQETHPTRPRVLNVRREDVQYLQENNEEMLVFLRRICSEAAFTLNEKTNEIHISSLIPNWARHGELCVRALLELKNQGSAIAVRVLPEESANATVKDLPGATLIEVPAAAANAVKVQDLKMFGDVIAIFVCPKEPVSVATDLTRAQADVSKRVGLSIGQEVEVQFQENQWFHATLRGFTEFGRLEVDWYRTDGTVFAGPGAEVEFGAHEVRARVHPRPPVVVASGKLLLLGERRARLSARLHVAVLADKRAYATGGAPGHGPTLAEKMLGLSEARQPADEDLDFAICSVKLTPETRASGSGWSERVARVGKVAEVVLEVLPGGRKALIGGDGEERRRARSILELLPKVGPFGDISALPAALEDWCSHLRVPSSAITKVRETLQSLDPDLGVLSFWLPPNSQAPRRVDQAWQPGAALEAQYRGGWHAATLHKRLQDRAQITWDYNGSRDEVSLDQVRLCAKTARDKWLRDVRILVLLGPERARTRAALAALASSEAACPGIWTGDEAAQEEARVEMRDGFSQESDVALEILPLPCGELDGQWLESNGGSQALRAVEAATPCALQLTRNSSGSMLLVAGQQLERERAQEYLTWAQKSRQTAQSRPSGLRGGGNLSVTDADMRDDVLLALLRESHALYLSSESLAAIERDTDTLLVFDRGGGSALEHGMRRLLICGSTDLKRAAAASQARKISAEKAETMAHAGPPASDKTDPWQVLETLSWPQCINDWGRLQKQIWAGHPRLKPGWIRCMSKSYRREYYLRLSDQTTTFDQSSVLA